MKPIVYYVVDGQKYPLLLLHYPAYIKPKNHPKCSNTKVVRTSPVIRIGAVGEFETMNTIYRPETTIEDEA